MLFWAEFGLFSVVLVGYPVSAWLIRQLGTSDKSRDRALFMPNGSVRAMLAILIVGSFLNVLVLGSDIQHFDQIVAAFGALTGAVIGFYFGTRGAQLPPSNGEG
jgi:hypothetical protein